MSFETTQEPVVMGRANYSITASQQAQVAQTHQAKYSPHIGITDDEIQTQIKAELNKVKK